MEAPRSNRPVGTAAAADARKQLGLLYDNDLCSLLNISIATLKNRRLRGELPPSSKVGRIHVTSTADLKAWIARRQVKRGSA